MVILPHPLRPQEHRLLQGHRNLVAQLKVELKGEGAKNWKPAPGEGTGKRIAGLVFILILLAQGSVSWATGECFWDPLHHPLCYFQITIIPRDSEIRRQAFLWLK